MSFVVCLCLWECESEAHDKRRIETSLLPSCWQSDKVIRWIIEIVWAVCFNVCKRQRVLNRKPPSFVLCVRRFTVLYRCDAEWLKMKDWTPNAYLRNVGHFVNVWFYTIEMHQMSWLDCPFLQYWNLKAQQKTTTSKVALIESRASSKVTHS